MISRLVLFLFIPLIISCSNSISNDTILDDFPEENFTTLGSDGPYVYGEKYSGRNNYINYYPGNIPIVLSIPHGGELTPFEISDRTYGVSVTDSNTIELGSSISDYMYEIFNVRPYLIINNLKRTKLDANRDKIEAAQNNIFAERAFDEFHYYISSAREDIIKNFGSGILFDIHGHGPNPDGFVDLRTWIGYLLTGNELDQNDKDLDTNISPDDTSIFNILNSSNHLLSDVIRGSNSLGSLFETYGFSALPSSLSPSPEGMRYFSGGYNTVVYGRDSDYNFNAIQLEFPYPTIRDNQNSINKFAEAFSSIIHDYFIAYFNIDLF